MCQIIHYIVIRNSHHVSTNRTVHFVAGKPINSTYILKIIQYKGDNEYYLIHFDKDENELTDTYHETIDDAMQQAEFEFNIKKSDWTKVLYD